MELRAAFRGVTNRLGQIMSQACGPIIMLRVYYYYCH